MANNGSKNGTDAERDFDQLFIGTFLAYSLRNKQIVNYVVVIVIVIIVVYDHSK